MSIGSELREAREKQGLSLKDSQEETKIRSKYLAALENEEFALIPGEAYVKAFIKGYADYLNLDGAKLVDEYNQIIEMERKAKEEEEEAIEQEKNESNSILHNKVFLSSIIAILILLLVGFVVYNVFLLNDSKHEVDNIAEENYNTDIAVNKQRIESEDEVEREPYAVVENDYNKVEEVSGQTVESFNNMAVDKNETVNRELDSKKKIVKLLVIDKTWLEIIVDSNKVFTGILEKGETKEYSGNDKLSLTIGNAAGVKLEIDGQEHGPWGRKGEVIKKEIEF